MNKSSRSNHSSENSPTIGETKLGSYRYRQTDVLGYGYESIVYKGRHPSKKFQVAIKAVDTSNLKDGINKTHFQNEIKCLEALKCTPHILNLLQKIEIDDRVYLVTELCTGDLSDEIENVLEKEQIWEYMKQLSKGFMYMWKENIIHRDIKPKNLFINARKDIKYGDFGFAVKEKELLKQKKYNVGSPAYMAPQAFKYNEYSHASDIWAIGIIFYQMWTGHLPWNCSTQEELEQRMNDDFIENFIKDGPFDDRSKQLLRRLLKTDPKQRMTAEQLMDFFNEKKKHDGMQLKKIKNMSHDVSSSTKEDDVPLELSSPFWQFKKKKQESPSKKPSGFSITLKSAHETPETEQKTSQEKIRQPLYLHKAKTQGPKLLHRLNSFRNEEKQQPKSALKPTLRKAPTQLFSPNPRARSQNNKEHGNQPDFVIKYLMSLAENCFDLFSMIENYQHMENTWTEHFPLLKVCYKNLIVKTMSELINIQASSKFLSQFCSTKDIKDYIYDNQYQETKEQCQALIQYFQENEELGQFWPKAKENNFLGTLNTTISFLEALKPHLKDNLKVQLDMALTGSLIARKIALYLSSSLNTIKNDNDDSATMRKNRIKVSNKIDQAIQCRKNLFD